MTHPPDPPRQPAVSPKTERALREAMDRLFSHRPRRTDGRLIKDNLWKEAGVSRATMNRATTILAEWDQRQAAAASGQPRKTQSPEVQRLRQRLRKSSRRCHQLQQRVDAAATVIVALYADNTALREQLAARTAPVRNLDLFRANRD